MPRFFSAADAFERLGAARCVSWPWVSWFFGLSEGAGALDDVGDHLYQALGQHGRCLRRATQVIGDALNINYMVTSFLGGTGLLIVVSVGLDLVQRIEANLIMRNYSGFLGGDGGSGGGPRIKGAYT